MQKPTMTTEPIRLPAWIGSLLALVILPALAASLTGVNWRTVLLGVIAALIPLLTGVEIKRGLTDSPLTAAQKAAAIPTTVAPDAAATFTTRTGKVLTVPPSVVAATGIINEASFKAALANLADPAPAVADLPPEAERAIQHSATTAPDPADAPAV